MGTKRSEFENRIVDEFTRRWEQNPPKRFARFGIEPSAENIRADLQELAKEVFDRAVQFDAPVVTVLYKNVAPENVRDASFLDPLKRIMLARRVPRRIIDSLFESPRRSGHRCRRQSPARASPFTFLRP